MYDLIHHVDRACNSEQFHWIIFISRKTDQPNNNNNNKNKTYPISFFFIFLTDRSLSLSLLSCGTCHGISRFRQGTRDTCLVQLFSFFFFYINPFSELSIYQLGCIRIPAPYYIEFYVHRYTAVGWEGWIDWRYNMSCKNKSLCLCNASVWRVTTLHGRCLCTDGRDIGRLIQSRCQLSPPL